MAIFNFESKNTLKRNIPIGIVIDRSESTTDIQDLLNKSIQQMLDRLRENQELCGQVEILAIHYNERVEIVTEFVPLTELKSASLDIRTCEGATNTGQALLTAIDKLRAFQLRCQGNQERCSPPMLFLFTDGYPDPGKNAADHIVKKCRQLYKEAAAAIREGERSGTLYFCAAGIQQKNGYCADIDQLKALTNHPERIICVDDIEDSSTSITRFCDMIRKSAMAMSSQSNPENTISAFFDLPADSIS